MKQPIDTNVFREGVQFFALKQQKRCRQRMDADRAFGLFLP